MFDLIAAAAVVAALHLESEGRHRRAGTLVAVPLHRGHPAPPIAAASAGAKRHFTHVDDDGPSPRSSHRARDRQMSVLRHRKTGWEDARKRQRRGRSPRWLEGPKLTVLSHCLKWEMFR